MQLTGLHMVRPLSKFAVLPFTLMKPPLFGGRATCKVVSSQSPGRKWEESPSALGFPLAYSGTLDQKRRSGSKCLTTFLTFSHFLLSILGTRVHFLFTLSSSTEASLHQASPFSNQAFRIGQDTGRHNDSQLEKTNQKMFLKHCTHYTDTDYHFFEKYLRILFLEFRDINDKFITNKKILLNKLKN